MAAPVVPAPRLASDDAVSNVTPGMHREMRAQIGSAIFAISGGRLTGTVHGIELPVAKGYVVKVYYTVNDDYTVERVRRVSGIDKSCGFVQGVYGDQLAEVAYRASCFESYGDGEWAD